MSAPLSKRTAESLSGLHPEFREIAAGFCLAASSLLGKEGVRVEVISGHRSFLQQKRLYAQGRTTPGKVVTMAKPGSSWHNYGLAMDLGLFADGLYLDEMKPKLADKLYAKLAPLAEEWGMEWAGNWTTFTETPHFQKRFGLTLKEARQRLEAAGYEVEKMKLK